MKRAVLYSFALVTVFASTQGRIDPAQAGPVHQPMTEGPFLGAAFHYWNLSKKTLPMFLANPEFEKSGAVPAVVRFGSTLSEKERVTLAKQGVALEAEPMISGAYLAHITEDGLRTLRASSSVRAIELALTERLVSPINDNAEATGIAQARRALRAKDGTVLDGAGITIADIDSGFFIFHPAFFRADAGAFAWKDLDGDGVFSPSADMLDLDGDGNFEDGVARLPGSVLDRYTGTDIVTASAQYTPDIDYVYVDANANGKRDFGAPAFDEETPAYGEPIFVGDDANRNGKIDTSEKFLRLGTNKFKSVRSDKVYVRGGAGPNALINYQPKAAALEGAGHGTGVVGILVGGQPGHSRFTGLVPAADIIGVDYGGSRSGTATYVDWAVKQGAQVLLTEYAPYAGHPLDGSSEEEKLFDAAFAKGIATSSPAGNLAGGKKHRTVQLAQGKTVLNLQTAAGFDGSYLIQISILTRSAAPLSGVLTVPTASPITLPSSSGQVDVAGRLLYADVGVTSRGTHAQHFVLLNSDQSALPKGAYSLELQASEAVEADIYVGDATTSWAGGFSFETDTPSRTICHPATADSVITVAAHVLNDETGFYPRGKPGELAAYSSRGPLIGGGGGGIELSAPDNPPSTGIPNNGALNVYEPFGGTSGAGPHVAAALGLLAQVYPSEGAVGWKKRLLDGATPVAGGPAESWGKGKLNLAKALDLPDSSGKLAVITIEAPGKIEVGEVMLRAKVAEDDGPPSLQKFRWDLDYDGTPDTEFGGSPEQMLQVAEVGTRRVRVEVIAGNGTVAAATASIEFVPKGSLPRPNTAPPEESGCGCAHAGRPDIASAMLALFGLALLRRRRSGVRA
jgi:MYXO-CTERM domain-containing protein